MINAKLAAGHSLRDDVNIALLHPGEMGAAIGGALVDSGKKVHWASAGRSQETQARASAARLIDDGDVATLLGHSDLVISVCPSHAALDVAFEVVAANRDKRGWIYIDANAIAPATARRVAQVVGDAGALYVDGGIIGPPPVTPGFTRLYLSGLGATEASEVLVTHLLDIRVIDDRPCSASALKLSYAAWTKGSSALLLAARAAAARAGVDEVLLEEWHTSQPGLEDRWGGARRSALEKGWRWSGEMREISSMLDEMGLPSGFHNAAAEIFEDPTTFG
jgi:3-hydroxyisobutyrate dehydrogenase-like beta-hydroxyacid dehydrogenase